MKKYLLSHQEYMILVEQAPIMIWRADTTTLCNYFNKRWLKYTGKTLAQEIGNGWVEGVLKEDVDRCVDIYLKAFHQREIFEMEYRLRRYDGVYRWIFDRGVPFEDDNGEFAGYIGSCTDIHEQVEARRKMLSEREKEIKILQGMLPICSSCKKIRDDNGYWNQVEVYIRDHADVEFSHGLCPDCLRTLYPDPELWDDADM